jgi:hypothetical protein
MYVHTHPLGQAQSKSRTPTPAHENPRDCGGQVLVCFIAVKMDDRAGCRASVLVATTTASQKKQKVVMTGGAFCGVNMRIVIMTVKGCHSRETRLPFSM